MKRSFLLLCFICSIYSSFAQNTLLKGVVRDGLTKEVIPGANIFDRDDANSATVSDENGNYLLKVVPGKHAVTCSFIGMKSETAELDFTSGETVVYNFVLAPESKVLNTVVVSAGKFEQKIEDITVSMEVLKSSLLENKNSNNVKGALEQVPGLTILDDEPQIRAGSGYSFGVGSHVAVLVDGIPVLIGDQGRPEWSFIATENVEQVEVIKGASSVLFGSSALSGVINLRTSFPKAIPETKVRIDYGQYDIPRGENTKWWKGAAPMYGYSFLHSEQLLKNKNLDFVIGGASRYDHNFIGPPGAQKSILFSYDTTTTENDLGSLLTRINFSLRYRSQKMTGLAIGLAGNFMQSHDNFSLVWLNDTSGLYRSYPNTLTISDMKIFYIDPFIEYFSKGGAKHSLKTRIFYDRSDDNMDQGTECTVYFEEYQFYKEIASLGGLHFTGGISGNQIHSHAELYAGSGHPVNILNNYAAFTQFDKKFKSVLNISVGFRGEYYEINKSENVLKPVLRAGMSLALSKATFFRMSYGQAYRYPSVIEKYIYTMEGGLYVLPNPDLKPETSQSTEAGIKQGFKLWNFYGLLDVAAFWQDYENTVEFNYANWDTTKEVQSNAIVGFKRVNTGSSRVRGLDFSVAGNGKIFRNLELTIFGGYTYALPQTTNPDYAYATENTKAPLRPQQLTYISTSTDTTDYVLKYRFEHTAKMDAELTWKFFTIGGDVRYYSYMKNIDKTFYTLDKPYAFNTGITEYRAVHNKGIWLYDARVRFALNKIFSLSFIVNNADNKSYSLRPLKIESPRTLTAQVMAKF
jgi:outer membrane cobalamin receptor